jgi:hypothetical protein
MKLKKIKITNFKCYAGTFEVPFNEGINIIVGSNESGKSTILEAAHLALTGMLNGRYIRNDLSNYLFNLAVEREYVASLSTARPLQPPKILIEVFFSGEGKEFAELEGDDHSDGGKASGVAYRIEFDEDNYGEAYAELVKAGGLKSIPIEYYTATMVSFARKGITARNIPIKSALIDSASSRLQNGSDVYISRIIRESLEEKERASISQAHRKLREAFMEDDNLKLINARITAAASISKKSVSISVDLSSQTAWESSSKLVIRCNETSHGSVVDRISRVFQHLFVDEVQDLAGYDLDVLAAFFRSTARVLLVGDPRQVTYLTHHEAKYKKYADGRLTQFLMEKLSKKVRYEIDEVTLNTSHRNSAAICHLSSQLYPHHTPSTACKCAECRGKEIEGAGIFVVKRADYARYVETYRPLQLRDRITSPGVDQRFPAMNFGGSKGCGFDRVIILPTEPMLRWLRHVNEPLAPQTRAKFYVALTRARHSVALVADWREDIPPGFSLFK